MVAFIVLKVPNTSISITDLNPLELSPVMGATKLPAAPALDHVVSDVLDGTQDYLIHDKINGS